MHHIMVKDKSTGAEIWIPLEQAAKLMGLAPDDIDWALEAHGECESEHYIAIEPCDW